eukprot:gene29447-38542_t
MFDTVLRCSADSIFEISGFLSAEECCKFSMAGKLFKIILDSDKIWDFYILYRIRGFSNTEFQRSYESVDLLKRILGYRRSKDFYVSFRRLQFNILGWFRALPPFHINVNGGLYCGRVVENEFLYQLVDTSGDIVGNSFSFKIRYDKGLNSLVAKSFGAEGKTFFVELGSAIEFIEFQNSSYSKLIPIEMPKILTPPDTSLYSQSLSPMNKSTSVDYCFGLHISPYGSHGLEILNISLHDEMDSCWLRRVCIGHTNIEFGALQLHGLKVTGDPNVPAGNISFCINMSVSMNPQAAIERDRRTIVSFPANSREPEFISLRHRADNIASWFRGYGQINRKPPTWNPEWVGCSLILYQSPLLSGARFTILWDNETEYYRHAMDFRPLPQGSAPQISMPILL